ncbi:hypothetical protein [Nocardia africana]
MTPGVYSRADWRKPAVVGRRASEVEVRGAFKAQKIRKLRKARGLPTTFPGDRLADHVGQLHNWGFTDYSIAAAAGVDQTTVQRIRKRAYNKCSIEYAQRILAVTHRPVPAQAGMRVPATGTRRRIRALQANGWTLTDIADQLGISGQNVCLFAQRRSVQYETWAAVNDLYEKLSGTFGPSELCAKRARAAGHTPPLAWDGLDMDHPDHEPDLGEIAETSEVDEVLLARILHGDYIGEVPKPERKAVIDYAIEHGWTKYRVAEVLNIKVATADQALIRRRRELRNKEAAA